MRADPEDMRSLPARDLPRALNVRKARGLTKVDVSRPAGARTASHLRAYSRLQIDARRSLSMARTTAQIARKALPALAGLVIALAAAMLLGG